MWRELIHTFHYGDRCKGRRQFLRTCVSRLKNSKYWVSYPYLSTHLCSVVHKRGWTLQFVERYSLIRYCSLRRYTSVRLWSNWWSSRGYRLKRWAGCSDLGMLIRLHIGIHCLLVDRRSSILKEAPPHTEMGRRCEKCLFRSHRSCLRRRWCFAFFHVEEVARVVP